MPGKAKVVVVGAGFAGLTLVRALRGRPVEMILLDRHNYHTFTPLLYQVASALLDPSEVAHPIRGIVRPIRNLEVRLAEATGIDLAGRRLLTDVEPVDYDFLVLCTGSTTNYFHIKGLAGSAFGLKDLEQAMALRNQVLCRFEEAAWTEDPERRRMLLTFAVVGGGPTGVEFSGALSELIRGVLTKDFPSVYIRETRILLVEAAPHLLGAFVPPLRESARRTLQRRGVEVLLDRQVYGAGEDHIDLSDGERINVGTVIWTAGVRAGDLAASLVAEHGRGGTVKVGSTLQLAGHPEVFVIGDLAAVEQNGAQLPQLIPPAMQEAKHVARTIMRTLAGEAAEPFRYADPGIMATIGRNAGVAEIGPIRMSGFPGWVLWLGFHLLQIVTFRAKLVVLVNWAWNYLFLDRPVRLLVRAKDPEASAPES
ncbi:MAG: NAD(P)/FAD-dependent oxidoreductase [Candidatus Dormibacteraeota bacterium]|nr:NAD(P)/FAD-dependent oxidoreductase [Candidatus Dormibacteraeota bacterium]